MTTLLNRTANRLRRTPAARKLRRLRVLASPAERKRGRRVGVPLRYLWFRLRVVGPVPEPLESIAISEPEGRPSHLRCDLAVVAGGTELVPAVVDVLIECERTSTPTLLLATEPAHLESELTAVCTDLATADQGIYAAAAARIGAERAHLLADDPGDARGWLRALVSLR